MSLGDDVLHLPSGPSDERRLWLSLVEQAARADHLKHELHAVRGSLSWRITAPLRAWRASWSAKKPMSPVLPPAAVLTGETINRRAVPEWWASLSEGEDAARAQWFTDVTELAREDLAAGVERVTRRLLSELLLAPPIGVRIQPVRLTPNGEYVCANIFLARFLGLPPGSFGSDYPIVPRPGDQLLGLDFCRNHAKPLNSALTTLRAGGVSINLLVHDVLPLTHPHWFPKGVPQAFEEWLHVLANVGHRALCNSHQTAAALAAGLEHLGLAASGLSLEVIPLGADFPPTPYASVLPPRTNGVTRVLTVGTIEPRKGHEEALAAFHALWARGEPLEWIIAGKSGWNVETLIDRIHSHPEFGHRLRWIKGPDDRELAALYGECDILLAPSLGEGFGLPVAEAGFQGMPLILRDLPVFREVAGARATYFSSTDKGSLERALINVSRVRSSNSQAEGSWATWAQSASRLKELCTPGSGAQVLSKE